MTSLRPYLLRALHAWVCDNGLTPHLLVDASRKGVQVPAHAVKDGQVVLNVAPRAVAQFDIDDSTVRFLTRFNGVSQAVSIPIAAVLAVRVVENGRLYGLPDDPAETSLPVAAMDESEPPGEPPPRRGGPHLRVVK
jgi:stringent starvation protein B